MDLIYNNETHNYEIAEFNAQEVIVKNFIESNAENIVPIVDDASMSIARKQRTVINNKLKEIQKYRKQINGVVMGEFNRMSLSIEKQLSEESDRITRLMEAYKPKAPVYELSIKTTDKEAYDKMYALAKELNLLKEEKE